MVPNLLGKRSLLKSSCLGREGDSDDGQQQLGGEVGDCLMSMRDVSYSSNDMDQLEIIEEQIQKRVNQISDMKQLNRVQGLSDDAIFNNDELLQDIVTADNVPGDDQDAESPDEDDEDDDDDDFECDIERYVKFDDKIDFAEKLKTVSKEGLTQIVKIVQELQPQALDDYGNNRLQLKIDMIERDAFLKCREILNQSTQVKRQKTEESFDNESVKFA